MSISNWFLLLAIYVTLQINGCQDYLLQKEILQELKEMRQDVKNEN